MAHRYDAVIIGTGQAGSSLAGRLESEQIIGAAVLGVGGDEVVNSLLDVMYARAPCTRTAPSGAAAPTEATSSS